MLRALVVAMGGALSLAACGAPAKAPVAQGDGWVGAGSDADAPGASAQAVAAASAAPVPVESCGATALGFEPWLASFRRYALEQQITAQTIERALAGVAYDPSVVEADRSQRGLRVSFAEFSARHVTRARLTRAAELLREDADLFARIEARFGVPREVLVAIWGLETDFGENMGRTESLRALATLAYDCRRAPRFRGELLAALRIVQRGDLAPSQMVGAWAGELGQTQFLPSSYEKYAIDFDGDGRADVVSSSADALGSTASYLAGHAWRAGEPFAEGTPNFEALGSWNQSEAYRRTIVLFASKLAPPAAKAPSAPTR
jgi:lytic murein transglycosylase